MKGKEITPSSNGQTGKDDRPRFVAKQEEEGAKRSTGCRSLPSTVSPLPLCHASGRTSSFCPTNIAVVTTYGRISRGAVYGKEFCQGNRKLTFLFVESSVTTAMPLVRALSGQRRSARSALIGMSRFRWNVRDRINN